MTELPYPGERPRRLLFCCVENQCRSQMAEAFARMHGGGLVEASSAGTRPSGRLHPKAVAAMRECGYDLSRHRSKGLAEVPDLEFGVVVTMGCGDVGDRVRARRFEDWDVPVPKDLPAEQFRAVRDRIEAKVKQLLVVEGILYPDSRPTSVSIGN
jgi:protein-tyrosine-phosphatase